jgi:hypothetical protein
VSKARGTQLQDINWDPYLLEKEILPLNQNSSLGKTQKEKIMLQLSAIALQLLNLRFNKTRLLFQEAGEYYIGKCLLTVLIFHGRDTLGDNILQGLFDYDSDCDNKLFSVFLLYVQELMLQYNIFFCIDSSTQGFQDIFKQKFCSLLMEPFCYCRYKDRQGENRLDYCTVGHFLQK